jgi:acid stress-induced BolA-like protein IbaG/YrbA
MEELIALLWQHFPNIETSALERDRHSHRITGHVVWDGFNGKSQIDRQNKLWDVLKEHASPEILASVGVILTLTPREVRAYREHAI